MTSKKVLTCLFTTEKWSKCLLLTLQEHHVTEKTEEQPAAMNAFELISMSKGLNLGNLFDIEQVCMLKKFSSFLLPWNFYIVWIDKLSNCSFMQKETGCCVEAPYPYVRKTVFI